MSATPRTSAPATTSRAGHPADWINLLGVRVSAVNLDGAVHRIQAAVGDGVRGWICIRDVHGVVRCRQDADLRRAHNEAFLVTPDGMPLVWSLRLAGHRTAGRVYGPDLMLALFDEGRKTNLRHYLFGGTPEILAMLEANLTARFPDATVAGRIAPPFRPTTAAEDAAFAAEINAARPDIVWVGLGTPKQELWMQRMRGQLDAAMLIGVGAAFDFHAGVKRQAPRVIQRSGFEWLFRLACEPRRLGMRYAVAIPSFLGLAAAQASGLRKFPIGD